MPQGDPIEYGLILAGGLALGAYQSGALGAVLAQERLALRAIAGASIGAINGAIVAGNAPEKRLDKLESFWRQAAIDPLLQSWFGPVAAMGGGRAGHLLDWTAAIESRIAGSPALFRMRMPFEPDASGTPSLYESSRARETMLSHIDFDMLNAGPLRYCCTTTDIETGECVVFDTAAGDRIEVEHLLASSGLLPSFAPQRIGNRLLGDGGFSANAPLEPFLASDRMGDSLPLYLLIDLFSPLAAQPRTLEACVERAVDLKYACQTQMRLEALVRERGLEQRLSGGEGPGSDLVHFAYQPLATDPGPEKPFDFARDTLAARAAQGREDALKALEQVPGELGGAGLRVHRLLPERT